MYKYYNAIQNIKIMFINKNQTNRVSIAVFATGLIILSIASISDNGLTYANHQHHGKLHGGNLHSPSIAIFAHNGGTSSQLGGQQCLPGQFCPSHP
jgi:hypothetical protein